MVIQECQTVAAVTVTKVLKAVLPKALSTFGTKNGKT